MPLQPGTRIGGFEIVALLGAGGMGEVYRARDQRLGRDVAIKVLSPQIAADAEALARFEREARALAALNHPNIAAIYGVEDNGAQPALVLELVDGETLADRIALGPLPIAQAIDYAKQIADALDTAHEAGIVHRDLKPGNVKITEDGRVKVLDFGLAKAIAIAAGESPDLDPANSPTITVQGTKHGVILGTAAYMSPEQARGKRIDKRTDIWAFGCVLYEMLTGKRAFSGETTSDVIAAIIERAPDLTLLPRSTPPYLRRIVERCLEKDPKRRARDIADVRAEFDVQPPTMPATTGRSRMILAVLALMTSAAIVAAVTVWRPQPAAPPTPSAPIEFSFGPPAGYRLFPTRSMASPDGRYIAFVARDDKETTALFLRAVETGAIRRLEGTEGITNFPIWSADSRSVAFLSGGAWRRLSVEGGPPVTIVSNIVANLGASWSADDIFLVAPTNRTAIARVGISGGSLQPVTTLDAAKENSHRWPLWLPGERHFLFTVRSDSQERLGIKVGSVDGGAARMLASVASQGIYTRPGWLLYATPDQAVMAQRLDASTWSLQGTAQPIAGPVRYNGPSFNASFDASVDGRVLTYVPAVRESATLEWFDRAGKPLGRIGPERDYRSVRLSPDGRTVAVELADPHVGTRDVWTIDTATQALIRLTSHPATDWRAAFSPDGASLAFASDREGASSIFRGGVSKPGTETLMFRTPGLGMFPTDWSHDGTQLFVWTDDVTGRPRQLLMMPVGGGAPVTLTDEDASLLMPRVSPDGDRIAFLSRVSGAAEIYVMSIRDRRRVRISISGGTNPVWGPGGKELFFQSPQDQLMRVGLNGTVVTDPPKALFRTCESVGRTHAAIDTESSYDVSADGARFLAICEPLESIPSAIHVIVNWQSKIK